MALIKMPSAEEKYAGGHVICDDTGQIAMTRYGYCEFCGSTEHEKY